MCLGFIVVDPKDRSVPVNKNGTRVVPTREYSVILQDWATKSSEESWMQLDDKTMKWMYGYDDFTQCWQPTRTQDGGNVGGAVPISAITINDKGWFNQDDIQKQPFNLPLERFKINPSQFFVIRDIAHCFRRVCAVPHRQRRSSSGTYGSRGRTFNDNHCS